MLCHLSWVEDYNSFANLFPFNGYDNCSNRVTRTKTADFFHRTNLAPWDLTPVQNNSVAYAAKRGNGAC